MFPKLFFTHCDVGVCWFLHVLQCAKCLLQWSKSPAFKVRLTRCNKKGMSLWQSWLCVSIAFLVILFHAVLDMIFIVYMFLTCLHGHSFLYSLLVDVLGFYRQLPPRLKKQARPSTAASAPAPSTTPNEDAKALGET